MLLASVGAAAATETYPDSPSRTRTQINDGWRFALGHATETDADWDFNEGYFSYLAKAGFGDGPAAPSFDDRGWREITLPHDWAAELDYAPDASPSHGFKAVGRGFPENSVGWYRHTFHVPESDLGRRIRVEFDGIYRDAAIFVNGFFVGQEPSGYLSQSYDLSEYLNYGGDNVVAVRADASMEEGWYYEGAGIYRHVYLLKTAPLHVARYGTYVTTEIEGANATVSVETTVQNEGFETATFQVHQQVIDAEGNVVSTTESDTLTLDPGGTVTVSDALNVIDASLWELDAPYLYTLRTVLADRDGGEIDRYRTPFGIREIRFDPDEGFFLNGRHVKLKGTNNHQDHAGVGTALTDDLQEYRLRQLKAMGSNAYRVSHHPASPALLEACDRLGMLVIDENRLMGINDYHLDELRHMILRDRNHPSVILWSIGNEEWAIEGNVKGARVTERMQRFVQRLDPTRRVTAAISGGWGGISTVVDVMGVNYIKHGDTDRQHRDYPQQIIVGTEETTIQATRGIYVDAPALAHQAPREDGSSGGNAITGWQHYAARDYAAGVFYWTGFDYRGEPTPFGWPAVLSQFGILDNCGFPKDSFYYLRAWWQNEPVLHVFPHWNWPGREGETIEISAYSNCDEVELLVNGESQGRQAMPRNGFLSWNVVYAPGELVLRGYNGGKLAMEERRPTTGPAATVKLLADRLTMPADPQATAVIAVGVHAADGYLVPTADHLVRFSLTGPGRIVGVGNGNPSSHEPEQFNPTVSTRSLGAWQAPNPADTQSAVVYEVRFDRPKAPKGAQVQLLLSALGQEQRVTLNGKVLFDHADPKTATAALPLNSLELKPTGNVLQIAAQPFGDWRSRELLAQTKPAQWKIIEPAPPAQRRVFNGLAQVIVQGTGEPGVVELRAVADGLTPATVRIHVEE
ncbi:MAG: beta-galactosidase GalA [Verrucomicrobiota bacterium JB022]|nr:beta-galactosidase GalA [Verrucomicrobiota bacterium JB022]